MDLHLSFWIPFFFAFLHLRTCVVSGDIDEDSLHPPRGWNSYDSFIWNINETEFLENAKIVAQRLLPHGYKYVVVDFLWYRRKDMPNATTSSGGTDTIDDWGRVIPDPSRWPSATNGAGFTNVANQVHQMGLKFGIHVMRGLSFQAYNADTLIWDPTTGSAYEEGGRVWTTKDIGIKDRYCKWMGQGFMAVNTSLGAGKAFLRSLYTQYAQWGVDFVKHDCVFGDDFDQEEISYVSTLLRELDRPILYSISPGTSVTPSLAKNINELVNMYRVTGDDWDKWEDVVSHFDVARDFAAANMIGAKGLRGRSWPDLDMLPLGWLSNPDSNEGPHRQCNLTFAEQKTQVTLWSMAKSPLMFGGDMRRIDDATYDLITNPFILDINSYGSRNHEINRTLVSSYPVGEPNNIQTSNNNVRCWVANRRSGEYYVAYFNLSPEKLVVSVNIIKDVVSLHLSNKRSCRAKEVWSRQDIGVVKDLLSKEIEPHGTTLYVVNC